MKTTSVDSKPFRELGNPAFAIDTPRDHISLRSLVLCVAKKLSGKTFFWSNLSYQLVQVGCMDRIFCLSDTLDSNKKMLENLDIRPEDILSPNDPDAVDKIVAEIDKERDDLLEYREKVRSSAHFHVEAATKPTSRSWDTSTPCHVPEAAPCAKHVCALYALQPPPTSR